MPNAIPSPGLGTWADRFCTKSSFLTVVAAAVNFISASPFTEQTISDGE